MTKRKRPFIVRKKPVYTEFNLVIIRSTIKYKQIIVNNQVYGIGLNIRSQIFLLYCKHIISYYPADSARPFEEKRLTPFAIIPFVGIIVKFVLFIVFFFSACNRLKALKKVVCVFWDRYPHSRSKDEWSKQKRYRTRLTGSFFVWPFDEDIGARSGFRFIWHTIQWESFSRGLTNSAPPSPEPTAANSAESRAQARLDEHDCAGAPFSVHRVEYRTQSSPPRTPVREYHAPCDTLSSSLVRMHGKHLVVDSVI